MTRAKELRGGGARCEAQTLVEVSLVTSPSIVLPPSWAEDCAEGASAPGGTGSPSGVFIPSLNPFTAPPRSCPMLRSFLVPNIKTTTSSTISQCQMLSPPMTGLLQTLDLGIIAPSGSGPPMTCLCKCITSCRPIRPELLIVRKPSGEPCSRG